jgi:N-acetylglutamate synthase-like GNAT family acetyltransferase
LAASQVPKINLMNNLTRPAGAPPITLRRARREDQKWIRQLVHQAGINRMGLDWRRFWVACDPAGRIVGIGQVKPHRDGSNELASLVVEPGMRGRGIASLILARLIMEHPIPLWLVCRSELVGLYDRFGFRAVADPAEMPPYFRRILRFVDLAGKLRGRTYDLSVMVLEFPIR